MFNEQLEPMAHGLTATSQSIRVRLEEQKKLLTKNVEKIDRSLELLDKNPDIEELLNLTRQIGV